MFYFSSLPLSEASPLPSTVHVYINEASWGYHKWKIAQKRIIHVLPLKKIWKKTASSLELDVKSMVTVISSYIIYYMASHMHLWVDPVLNRTCQRHKGSPKNVLISNCGHSLDKRSTTDEERPGVIFSNFRWYKRHPKFFWYQNSQQSKHQKNFSHKIRKHVVFFRKSMIYPKKPKTRIPNVGMSTMSTYHLGQGADPLVQHGGWNLKSSKGGAWMNEPLIRWSWKLPSRMKHQTSWHVP